jgi:hypothetical protein
MPNSIKYSTTTPLNSLRKGNIAIGVNDVDMGPTTSTGWYNGVTPILGNYVIYKTAATGDPDVFAPQSDQELYNFVIMQGGNSSNTTSVGVALSWIALQPNLLVVNNTLPNIVTNNLRVNVDANLLGSYPTINSTWYDLSGNGQNFNNGVFSIDVNGYYLSSSGNTVETATTDALNTDYHTIMLILRFTGTTGVSGGWQQFIGYYGGGTDRSPGIWRYPSNRRIHWTYNPGNTATDFGANGLATDFPLDQDFLVIMRKNGSNTDFWIDNTKYNGITGCANPKTPGNSPIRLYSYYGSELMQIKYFSVYDAALTDDECYQNAISLTPRLIK